MSNFLKMSSESMSSFSMFLKIPESMTLSVLFWLILFLFCSKFSQSLFTLPLTCPRSYYNFLNLFSSTLRFYELLLSRKLASSSLYCSIFPFIRLMMVPNSAWMSINVHFCVFHFIISWPVVWRFLWVFRFYHWWTVARWHRFLLLWSMWWKVYYLFLEGGDVAGLFL